MTSEPRALPISGAADGAHPVGAGLGCDRGSRLSRRLAADWFPNGAAARRGGGVRARCLHSFSDTTRVNGQVGCPPMSRIDRARAAARFGARWIPDGNVLTAIVERPRADSAAGASPMRLLFATGIGRVRSRSNSLRQRQQNGDRQPTNDRAARFTMWTRDPVAVVTGAGAASSVLGRAGTRR